MKIAFEVVSPSLTKEERDKLVDEHIEMVNTIYNSFSKSPEITLTFKEDRFEDGSNEEGNTIGFSSM